MARINTSTAGVALVTGYDANGVQVRKRFTEKRHGRDYRTLAQGLYEQLLFEKSGLTDAQEHGAKAKAFRKMTFGELADRYVREHLIPRTRSAENKAYIETLKLKWGRHRLCTLAQDSFRDWIWFALDHKIETLRGSTQYSPATVEHLIQYGARVFNWGIERGIIDKNPLVKVKDRTLSRELTRRKRRNHKQMVAVLSSEEFWAFMAWEKLPEFVRRPAVLAWCTGMREGEICNLQWTNVDGDRILFDADEVKETDDKEVYMEREAYEMLTRIQADQLSDGRKSKYVFLNEHGRRLSGCRLSHKWLEYRKAYAKETKNDKFLYVTFHRLRNSYRTRKAIEGHDAKVIAANMGHHSAIMSDHYNVVDESRRRRLTGFDNSGSEKLSEGAQALLNLAEKEGLSLEDLQATLRTRYRGSRRG